MKTMSEVAFEEWRASRDAFLDAYVENTGNTYFPQWFIKRISDITTGFRGGLGVNLNIMNPLIVHAHANSDIVNEIVALHRLTAAIEHLISEAYNGAEKAINAFMYLHTGDFDETEWIDDDDPDPYCEDIYDEWDPRLYED